MFYKKKDIVFRIAVPRDFNADPDPDPAPVMLICDP
jgi:hypothetical protein